jgi:YaiO family outer membrane protein
MPFLLLCLLSLALPTALASAPSDSTDAPSPASAAARPAVPAADPVRWSGTGFVDYLNLRDGGHWLERGVQAEGRFPGTTLVLTTADVERFGRSDRVVRGSLYRDLWTGAYGHLRVGLSGQELLPGFDWQAELTQSLGGGWGVVGAYRGMHFATERIDILTAGVHRYIGAWYLRGRASLVPRPRDMGGAAQLAARRLFAEGHVELVLARGREVIATAPDRPVRVQSSWAGALLAERTLVGPLRVKAGLQYVAEDRLTRWGGTLGLGVAW